jgi:hypothetical protein
MGFTTEHTPEFWRERIGASEGVQKWHFYAYEYLDDLAFMKPARELFEGWAEGDVNCQTLEEKFRELGWDGDGVLQVMWLPPFAGAGPHDFYGCYAMHIKQTEDGISWIASPYSLPFDRLFQRDDAKYDEPGTRVEKRLQRKGAVRWLSDLWR